MPDRDGVVEGKLRERARSRALHDATRRRNRPEGPFHVAARRTRTDFL